MPIYPEIYDGPPHSYTARWTRKRYIAVHNTSNDASAEAEASYAKRRTDSVSSHYYVDPDSLIQSLNTDHRAWHAGSTEGNDRGIAYEITGTNGKSRTWWLGNVAWAKLAQQIAVDCREWGIVPQTLTVAQIQAGVATGVITHDQMRLAWGGTDHTDPGPNFPMDHLIALVRAELEDDMPLSDADAKALINRVNSIIDFADTNPYGDSLKPEPNKLTAAIKGLQTDVAEVAALALALAGKVDELAARPPVQPAPVDAAAVKAVLLDPEVVAAYAKAAADLVHADLAD